jgi:hypothetical protein
MHGVYEAASLIFSILMVMFAFRESITHLRPVVRAFKAALGRQHRNRIQFVEIVLVLAVSGLIASGPAGYYALHALHQYV